MARGRPTLRVAHFSDTYVPRRDGIVTSLQTLTAAMAEVGHQSLLVVPSHPDQDGDDRNLLRIRSLPCGVAQFRLAAWPASRHVERVGRWLPHVVHVHTPGPIGLLGVLTARRLGLPLVQTYHTDLHAYAAAYRLPARALGAVIRCYARRLGVPCPPLPGERDADRAQGRPGNPTGAGNPAGTGNPGRDGAADRAGSRRERIVDAGIGLLLGESDAVLVPTEAVLGRCELPVPPERLYLAPAGVTLPPVTRGARERFRARHGIGPSEPVVLFVGRVNREKGIDLLTEAFGRMAREVRDARLVLVGAVYEPRWLARLLQDAGIVDRTVLTGQLDPAVVAEAYAAADLFAFPSRTDTQGLVLQEAALAGLPSVLVDPALARTGPLAGTAVVAGGDALAFADAMADLLTDRPRCQELGRIARERAQRHSPQAYAALMTVVYTQALRRVTSATRAGRRRRHLVRRLAS